jgi:hypothetical protein
MKKLFLAGLVLSLMALGATPAEATGLRHRCCRESSCCEESCAAPAACAPAPAPAVTYEEREVTCYRPVWKEREVKCTVNKLVSHEEVTKQKYTVCVPVWTEKKETCTVYERVAREVEREVTCCRMVRKCEVDPCTGCTRTVCCPERVVQKVKCTVYECVPRTKEVTVKVCSYKEEQKERECRRTVCEWKPETVVRKEKYCEMEAYKTKVKVAVCAAAPCAAPCEATCCKSECGHRCGRLCGHRGGHRCGGHGDCGGCGGCGGHRLFGRLCHRGGGCCD